MIPDRDTDRRNRLQSRLFRSHLGVMFLALAILMVVGGTVGFLLADVGPRGNKNAPEGFAFLLTALAGFGAAALAASIMARRATKRIAEPIHDVGQATREMAQGTYSTRVPPSDVTELADLAEDVNSLSSQLEEIEARRLQLIGDIAHELRTPLQTIEGSMEALLDGVVEPTDETFAAIADEAARLKRLATDLSNLSKTMEGAAVLDRQPTDLAGVLREVTERLRHQFDAAGVALTVAESEPVIVIGDADRLTQILTNIVGNALAYTPAGGSVTAKAAVDDGLGFVTVEDNGRGLTDEQLRGVFERFYRVDPKASTGTGVGLTIARALARAHGGDITASSAGQGAGSTFTLRIPLDE